MARKIKFPLIMENDVKVRSLEALKENFDIYQVFTYYRSGKLLLWLKNIYLDEEADKVKNLDSTEDIPLLSRQLYEVFGLPYTAIDEEKAEKIQDRENRKKRLQEKTSNDEILERIDEVAFDNEELDMRLKEGCKEIFLCGEAFTIPVEFENVTYYGVNKPVVSLDTEDWVDLDEKKIRLKDIKLDYSLIRNNRIKNGRKYFNDEYDNTVKVTDSEKVKQLYRKIVRQMQACHRKVSVDQVLKGKGNEETRKISIALNDFCKLDKYEFKYQPSIHDVTDVAFDVCGILANSIIYYCTPDSCEKFNEEKYNEFKKKSFSECFMCHNICLCVEKLRHSCVVQPDVYKGMDKVVALRFVFFFLYCLIFETNHYYGAQRLTKACELALCMELSEDEVLDLVTVLLIINGLQESSKEQFKTKTVWDNFNCVLNCGYNPLPEE